MQEFTNTKFLWSYMAEKYNKNRIKSDDDFQILEQLENTVEATHDFDRTE